MHDMPFTAPAELAGPADTALGVPAVDGTALDGELRPCRPATEVAVTGAALAGTARLPGSGTDVPPPTFPPMTAPTAPRSIRTVSAPRPL